VRVDERRFAAHHVHSIARELVGDDRSLTLDDFVHAREQLGRSGSLQRPSCAAVWPYRRGEVHDGLAKSLARDRTGGEARSTNGCSALDQRNALTKLCRLNGAALSCRTAADADQVVVKGCAHGAPKLADLASVSQDWRSVSRMLAGPQLPAGGGTK
jgi:hypothetical protein